MTDFFTKIPLVQDAQAARELKEGSVLVIDCNSASYRLLNATGSFLWKHIDGHKKVAELVDLLSTEFGIDKDNAKNDTEIFIKDMSEKGMISWQS